MADGSVRERLAKAPIGELNLGSTKLRRAIICAGYKSIVEVLELPDKVVDATFDLNDADAIVAMQEEYRNSPEVFVKRILAKKVIDASEVDRALNKHAPIETGTNKLPSRQSERAYHENNTLQTLPTDQPFSKALLEFEKRARDAFDEHVDRNGHVMAYQVFEEFTTEFDDIADAFGNLFRFCPSRWDALQLTDKYLGDIFIVYVADRSRTVYKEGNLWGNFFDNLGIGDSNIQAEFKRLFMAQIKRRNMPLYSESEEVKRYLYTALLHGGLSGEAWRELWQKSFLPLASEIAKNHFGFTGEMDGHIVLQEIKNPNSSYAPGKKVQKILEKAPSSMLVSLFTASMKVGMQVESAREDSAELVMLSSYGLPDVAMQALRINQEYKAEEEQSAGFKRVRRTNGSRSKRLVYLPMGHMRLDLADGTVCLSWPKQQFPLHFSDYRIDYYVNGSCVEKQPFQVGVEKCYLNAAEVSVAPQPRYDVELRLIKVASEGKDVQESSLRQVFARTKPGCFEFVENAKNLFQLRGQNEHISKKKRIAYLIKNGLRIEPSIGMKPLYEYESGHEWAEAKILLYEVEPGASGTLVDELSGEEVAVWQECYSTKIDKHRIIGKTDEGLDLYGYMPCENGQNGGLPSICIEAADGLAALDDLDVICDCDGTKVSIQRRVSWKDEFAGKSAAQIELSLQESSFLKLHIETCTIEAKQKSASKKVVFRYRFAVVPIQGFRLENISFDYGIAVADYCFQSMQMINITDSQGQRESVSAYGRHSMRTLLKDDFLVLRIESTDCGKATNARFALAALDIKLPQRLVDISNKRTVYLSDVLDLGASEGNIRLSVSGWRYNRAALVLLGGTPMFFKELKQPGDYEFNVLRDMSEFVPTKDSKPSDKPCCLSICYGDDVFGDKVKPAWTDIELMRFKEGFGIDGWQLLVNKADGMHVLRFAGTPFCDLQFEFKKQFDEKVIDTISVSAGVEQVELSEHVMRQLNSRKKLDVTVAPMSLFGDPDYEYSTTYVLER